MDVFPDFCALHLCIVYKIRKRSQNARKSGKNAFVMFFVVFSGERVYNESKLP